MVHRALERDGENLGHVRGVSVLRGSKLCTEGLRWARTQEQEIELEGFDRAVAVAAATILKKNSSRRSYACEIQGIDIAAENTRARGGSTNMGEAEM